MYPENEYRNEQIILEKGRTMMEVDSIHSMFESLFKTPISVPIHYTEWEQPDVKHILMMYISWAVLFFKAYGDLPSNCHSIRQGKIFYSC